MRHQQLEEQKKQPHHVIAGARRWSVFASSFVRQGLQWRPCPPSFGWCEIQLSFQTATVNIQNKGFSWKIFRKHSSYTSLEKVHIHMTKSPNKQGKFTVRWCHVNLIILRPAWVNCWTSLVEPSMWAGSVHDAVWGLGTWPAPSSTAYPRGHRRRGSPESSFPMRDSLESMSAIKMKNDGKPCE